MKVVVTGAGGCLGEVVVSRLLERPDVESVVGVDLVAIALKHPKFTARHFDMRQPCEPALFGDADVLIHLAFAIAQGRMTVEEMEANNVGGTLNVFRAAEKAGIKRVINLSSVSVYGSGEHLTEDAPLAPSARFPYAQQKVAIETSVREGFAGMSFIHFRATFILGPRAAPMLRKMCTSRVYIVPPRPHPRIQVVHEEDVASAILSACSPSIGPGTFNLAAPQVVTFPQLVRDDRSLLLGIPISALEFFVGRPPADGSPRTRPADTTLDILRTTLTVNCDRARRILGWTPKYSAWEARAAFDRPVPPKWGLLDPHV